MGNFSSATGTVTLFMMLLGRTIFEKFGWKFAAMVTPTVSLGQQHLVLRPAASSRRHDSSLICSWKR